jgi:hypothetical protein
MVVFASLVVGFCSGFPSLFGGAPLTLLLYNTLRPDPLRPALPCPDLERRESQRNAGWVPFGALAAPRRQAPAAVLWSPWVSTALQGSISVASSRFGVAYFSARRKARQHSELVLYDTSVTLSLGRLCWSVGALSLKGKGLPWQGSLLT